jgi:hypothetical protein
MAAWKAILMLCYAIQLGSACNRDTLLQPDAAAARRLAPFLVGCSLLGAALWRRHGSADDQGAANERVASLATAFARFTERDGYSGASAQPRKVASRMMLLLALPNLLLVHLAATQPRFCACGAVVAAFEALHTMFSLLIFGVIVHELALLAADVGDNVATAAAADMQSSDAAAAADATDDWNFRNVLPTDPRSSVTSTDVGGAV